MDRGTWWATVHGVGVGPDCACMHARSAHVCEGIRQEWGKKNPKGLRNNL